MLLSDVQVLVTGCAGFIGSHLSERLLADGCRVIGVDALTDFYDPQRKLRNLQRLRDHSTFQFLHQNVLDLTGSVLEGAEAIFHLAARPGVRTSWGADFRIYTEYNILATQHLLELASRAPSVKRFVFASSSSVYGDTREERVAESHYRDPISPYGVSKLAAEQLCRVYSKATELQAIPLRLFTVYGPRQRPDMAFERLVQAAVQGAPFILYGSGEQQRDFTFVKDVVDAFVRAATVPDISGEFNVAGGDIVSMNQVIGVMEELIGRPIPVERVGTQSGDVWHTGGDLTRSRQILGYSPRTSLQDGLRQQLQAH